MKVVDISFYFGIVVVILTFITMVCFVWEDIHRHKEKITQNIGKYGVFICMWLLLVLWTVFIAVKYYLYVLFSEFTSDNKSDVIKIQRQTIFLSVMTILVGVYFMYKYFNIFLFWVSV